MWVVPHELLQFCRDKSCEPFGSHENNEDNFIDITDILSNDTISRNYDLPYESNKKVGQTFLTVPTIIPHSRAC